MTTRQQEEALRYFREHAQGWKSRASSADQRKVNVIRQRNGFVLAVIKDRAMTRSALDVGCGTGDLVWDIARKGIDATGVDFADAMIDVARAGAQQQALTRARFYCCSIFHFEFTERSYDVVSANGFIEYICPEELDRFLDLSHRALSPGGSLVLGSRNRLFNLISLNGFTVQEINNGTVAPLLREAMALVSGVSLAALPELDTAPLQCLNDGQTRTGIDVSTRYQFTPAQLARMLSARGFAVKQLCPVHIHGVPPAFKDRHPDTHASISNLLQNYAPDHVALLPYASSFMLHAEKER